LDAQVSRHEQFFLERVADEGGLGAHAQMMATQGFYCRRGWTQIGGEGDKVYFALQQT
jgi:hypothetical protein